MRTLIIGEMDRNEQLYNKLGYSDEVFEINMVVSEDRTYSDVFHCEIMAMEEFERLIMNNQYGFLQDYDIVFLCSQGVWQWRQLLMRCGVKGDRIKLDMQVTEFLSPQKNMDYLSEYIYESYQAKYKNDDVTIGEYSYGMPYIKKWTETAESVVIGKFCSIAENVEILLGENHRLDWVTTFPFNTFLQDYAYIEGHPMSKGDVVIGNDVWIGAGVRILSGVTIGDGAVLAASALITKDVEPYTIVGGVPAHMIKKRFSDEIIERLLEIKWWDWDKELIYEAVPLLQSASFDQLFEFYERKVRSGSC